MTDDQRGDPVPVVAEVLRDEEHRAIPMYVKGEGAAGPNTSAVEWVGDRCSCGWRPSGVRTDEWTDHVAERIIERLYGEGLLAYGVGKREET